MNKTIITHFYNEEFLLPLWLNHHKQYFDFGVLIDYGSTDRSVEIIKEICPHWQILNSNYAKFDHAHCDYEVTFIENQVDGWRISIPVTEFVVGDIEKVTKDEIGNRQVLLPVTIFAGYEPNGSLVNTSPLWEQVSLGIPYDRENVSRSLHNFKGLKYAPGRHFWGQEYTKHAMIFKYSSCLVGPEMIKRRLQIAPKVSDSDIRLGCANHHLLSTETLETYYMENIVSKNPVDCSREIYNMTGFADYSVQVFSNKPDKFIDIQKSIEPEKINYFDGSSINNFSKLINSCVYQVESETVILCSDKILPKLSDIKKIVELLNNGYAFVSLYKFAFFGLKKELFRRIGPLDERFLSGGYEDFDYILRIKEANLALYISNEATYISGPSSWNYDNSWEHWCNKWSPNEDENTIRRKLPEVPSKYDLGPNLDLKYLSFENSTIFQNENMKNINDLLNKRIL